MLENIGFLWGWNIVQKLFVGHISTWKTFMLSKQWKQVKFIHSWHKFHKINLTKYSHKAQGSSQWHYTDFRTLIWSPTTDVSWTLLGSVNRAEQLSDWMSEGEPCISSLGIPDRHIQNMVLLNGKMFKIFYIKKPGIMFSHFKNLSPHTFFLLHLQQINFSHLAFSLFKLNVRLIVCVCRWPYMLQCKSTLLMPEF